METRTSNYKNPIEFIKEDKRYSIGYRVLHVSSFRPSDPILQIIIKRHTVSHNGLLFNAFFKQDIRINGVHVIAFTEDFIPLYTIEDIKAQKNKINNK